jgi:2-dehydropantoate 2-reductase
MRIAIMGAGAVGGYVGAQAAQVGHVVSFIARGAHLEAIRQRGLRVQAADGEVVAKGVATDDPAQVGPVDLVLFCVKSYDTDAAAAAMKPLIGPGTLVVPLQNGVESEERIARAIGPGHVLGGSARVIAVIEEPGVIRVRSVASVVFGEIDGAITPRAERLLEALKAVPGCKISLTDDVVGALWSKLIFICGVGGMTSLCRSPIGPVVALEETRGMLEQAMRECEAVARARGVRLAGDVVEKQFRLALTLAPDAKSSMLHDLERGKRLEVEALNGAIARYGREAGVATPVNAAICAVLKLWAG